MRIPRKISYLLIGLFIVLTVGCTTTTDYKTSSTGTVQNIQLAVKDFDIIGPIRLIIQQDISLSKHQNNNSLTYDKLLAEAYKMGADDVVNIRIDTINENNLTENQQINTYTVNALAIKYTKSLLVPATTNWMTNTIPNQTYESTN